MRFCSTSYLDYSASNRPQRLKRFKLSNGKIFKMRPIEVHKRQNRDRPISQLRQGHARCRKVLQSVEVLLVNKAVGENLSNLLSKLVHWKRSAS